MAKVETDIGNHADEHEALKRLVRLLARHAAREILVGPLKGPEKPVDTSPDQRKGGAIS
jgi:hypothetical protein